MPRKAIKGQAVVNFLADHLVLGTLKLYDGLPDEIAEVNVINASSEEQVWQLFFDGASRTGLREMSSQVWGGTHFLHIIT